MNKRVVTLLFLSLFFVLPVVSFGGTDVDSQQGYDTLEKAVEVEALKALGYTPDSDISLQAFRERDNWVYGAYVYPALGAPDSKVTQAESSIFIAYKEGTKWFAAHAQTQFFSDLITQAPGGFLSEEETRILSSVGNRGSLLPNSTQADGSSLLALPWDPNTSGWRLTQGPHSYYGGNGHSSLDLNGPQGVHSTVRAARDGIAYQVDCATPSTLVMVLHADGWKTSYLHLEEIQVPAFTSYPVSRWQWLGRTGFVGRDGCGVSNGVHLHFTLWKNDAEYNLHDVAIGGYVVDTGTDCLTHPVFGKKCQWDGIPNDGTIGEYPPVCTQTSLHGVNSPSVVCDDVVIYDQANSGGNVTWQGNVGFSNDPGGNDLQYRLEIAEGMSVKTWRGDNKTGEERCWSQTIPNLQDHGWQNDIESIEVFGGDVCPQIPPKQCGPGVGPDVQIFEHANCDGSSHSFPSAGLYKLHNFNDKASAIHVPNGKSVALFEHIDGNGEHRCIPENADLWNMSLDYWPNGTSMNDSVSSIRVFNSPVCEPYIETISPSGWCSGGVGWVHGPYDIPQNPGCLGGEYVVDQDGIKNRFDTFQQMASFTAGKWAGLWFEPQCGDAVPFNDVTVFENISCSGGYQRLSSPGLHNLTILDNKVTSIHIPAGRSVLMYERPNGTGQVQCRAEMSDMWHMLEDTWPDGSVVDNTISSVKVFNSPDCPPFKVILAPVGWCSGGVGWVHGPYDIPQDPGCLGGEYVVDQDGVKNRFDTFQQMTSFSAGKWAGMWFEPQCGDAVPFNDVTIFENISCSGSYQRLSNPDLHNLTTLDNKGTSIHIPAGHAVLIYEGLNGTGQVQCRVEMSDMWHMLEDIWPDGSVVDNTISSIKVFYSPDCPPFKEILAPPGWCSGGVGWVSGPYDIPQDPGCLGGEYVVDQDDDKHRFSTFQQMVNFVSGKWAGLWFEPQCGDAVPFNDVTVFENISCSGSYQRLSSPGLHNLTTLDNKVTSIHIPAGRSVLMYEGPNGTGQVQCQAEMSDMWHMLEDIWPDGSVVDNTISSVKVFNSPDCPPFKEILAPVGWCSGGVGWVHGPYDIPQDPGCLGGEYVVDQDGDKHRFSTFQQMASFTAGQWAGLWFEPQCGDAVPFNDVTIFENISCSGSYQRLSTPGLHNLTILDNKVTSIHIPAGRSVLMYEGSNGTGQVQCRAEMSDMWHMLEDKWPDGSVMDNTISSVEVFYSPDCSYVEYLFHLYTPITLSTR